MNLRKAVYAWGALGLLGAAIEAWALADDDHRDTLSGLIWTLKRTDLGHYAWNALYAWLAWHFAVQPSFPEHVELALRDTPIDDMGVVAIALLTSVPPRIDPK